MTYLLKRNTMHYRFRLPVTNKIKIPRLQENKKVSSLYIYLTKHYNYL